MENTFDLKKFLVENKLTSNSRLVKEQEEVSPAEAAQVVTAQADKIAQDPTVKKIVDNILNDPAARKELLNLASKNGIAVDTVSEGADDLIYKLSLGMAKKVEREELGVSEDYNSGPNVGSGILGGGFLGGVLANYIAPHFEALSHQCEGLFGEMVTHPDNLALAVGALIGAILGVAVAALTHDPYDTRY